MFESQLSLPIRWSTKPSSFKRFSTNYLLMLLLVDSCLIQVIFWLSLRLRFVLPIGRQLSETYLSKQEIPLLALQAAVGLIWLLSFVVASVYASAYIVQWIDEFQRIIMAHTVAALCLAGMLYMANIELMRLSYLYFYLLTLAALLSYRILLRLWHRIQGHALDTHNVMVIGSGDNLVNLIQQIQGLNQSRYHLVGLVADSRYAHQKLYAGVPIVGQIEQLDVSKIVEQYGVNDVVLALPRHVQGHMVNLIEQLRNLPVNLRVIPDYFDLTFRRASIGRLGYIPVIDLHDSPLDSFQRVAKRLIDLVGAAVILCFVWPVMALVALAIKLEDNGPIFYYAERVGEHGRLFTMYKFRSMVVNADRLQAQVNQQDKAGNIIHKSEDDPRITRVGRIIRRTSLDELPQLLNVLKGEMSLVGPRPELPWLVEQYERWQYRRLAVPQGITGWWQINGRSNNLMHLNTEQDLYYVQNYSIWLDLQILWRTVDVVLRGKGAY
ncbi:MAG: sugar transferase [Caldilineaceae bacterium]